MSAKGAPATVSVRDAVNSARNYLRDFADVLPGMNGLRLEETDFDEKKGEWYITISFQESPFDERSRTYKLFRIGAQDGEVKSMKTRTLE